MVRVEMGQEDRLDATMDEAQLADVAGTAIAGVEDKQALARHDHGAGAHAPVIGHWRARTAQPTCRPSGKSFRVSAARRLAATRWATAMLSGARNA